MQSLEQLISHWRATMRKNLDTDSVEELEQHLRETIAADIRAGQSPADAFASASKSLGSGDCIAAEFNKVSFADWWAVKVSFVGAAVVTLIALYFLILLSGRQFGWWLGTHVAAVTIGYFATFITGALGIAYVTERCFSDFTGSRLRAAAKTATVWSGVAAILVAVAILFGMVWAKLAWGRYWAWDPKETGAFGILVWLIPFYIGGKSRFLAPRAVMLLSIVGNMVVSVSWFGANMSYTTLICLLALHAPFLALGFAPPRCFSSPSEAGSP
jgi:hypothetical protein